MAMIDAVVAIHAFGVQVGAIDEASRYWDAARRSHDLVESADSLQMSAINWFEVLRGMRGNQQAALATYKGRIMVLPVDARVAECAADIYARARKSGKVCRKCFAFVKATVCSACHNQRSEPQRSNDIVMVATASVSPEVTVLYSWDQGVLALGEFVTDVVIRTPPEPSPKQINLDGTPDLRVHRRRRSGK